MTIKAYQKKYHRERRQRDGFFRCAAAVRSRTRDVLREHHATKHATQAELLGCSIAELRHHIAKQFVAGMNWDNYGTAWHLDHVVPCAVFNLHDARQQALCFHHCNLQPLWADVNLAKGDKLPSELL